jgi:hypothetical protein
VRLLGLRVVRSQDLGRSHSRTLHRMVLEDGREVFVKRGGDFTAEAEGLRWAVPNSRRSRLRASTATCGAATSCTRAAGDG